MSWPVAPALDLARRTEVLPLYPCPLPSNSGAACRPCPGPGGRGSLPCPIAHCPPAGRLQPHPAGRAEHGPRRGQSLRPQPALASATPPCCQRARDLQLDERQRSRPPVRLHPLPGAGALTWTGGGGGCRGILWLCQVGEGLGQEGRVKVLGDMEQEGAPDDGDEATGLAQQGRACLLVLWERGMRMDRPRTHKSGSAPNLPTKGETWGLSTLGTFAR